MNKLEMKQAFIESVERERTARGYTQQEMAEKLDMSLPGYRKMVAGLTESISLWTAHLASKEFGILIPTLYGSTDYKNQVANELCQAPENEVQRVQGYLEYYRKIRSVIEKNNHCGKLIEVYTFSGYMKDGMDLDSRIIETKGIPEIYSNKVIRAVKITDNTLAPLYVKGDVILLGEDMPRSGEAGVFLNMRTLKLYFRKLIVANERYELHSLNGRSAPIYFEHSERREWYDYGPIIRHIREDELINIEDREE